MIHWESHACLPLHTQACFAPIDRLPPGEARRLQSLMGQALGALWKARKE